MAPPDVAAACGAPQLGQKRNTLSHHRSALRAMWHETSERAAATSLVAKPSKSRVSSATTKSSRETAGTKAYRVQFITEFAVAVIPYSDFSCEYRICSRVFGYESEPLPRNTLKSQ